MINKIDDFLGQHHTADDGPKYSDLSISHSVKLPIFDEEVGESEDPLDDSMIDQMFNKLV